MRIPWELDPALISRERIATSIRPMVKTLQAIEKYCKNIIGGHES